MNHPAPQHGKRILPQNGLPEILLRDSQLHDHRDDVPEKCANSLRPRSTAACT